MKRLSDFLTDNDLLYVIKTVLPENRDNRYMLNVLREDCDILEGMLYDPALLHRITEDKEEILKISPFLFFAVLISGVRRDLKQLSFTLEREKGELVPVFDSSQVQEFFDQPEIRLYLITMLASFVRINSYSVSVRVRKGIWYTYRYSDFNVDSLMKHIELLEPEERFPTLKRIADLCLFVTGVFPETLLPAQPSSVAGHTSRSYRRAKTKEEMTTIGKTYYETASRHRIAVLLDLKETLESIGDHFELAVKPLMIMGERYLRPLKQELFP